MRFDKIAWLLTLAAALAVRVPLDAQQRYAAVLATESNNQRKLIAAGGSLYVTYAKPVDGVPQVFVDISSDGRTWRTLGQVSDGDAPSTLSTVIIDREGRVHVAWTRFHAGIGRVYYSRYDGRWSTPSPLSSPTSYAGYPALDIDSRGRLHLVWYGIREASAGQVTTHGGIYEIYYLTNDGLWSRPERISEGYPDAINAALAVDDRDRLHVAWFQSDGRAYQVTYRQRADRWSAPAVLTSGPSASTKPAVAVDGAGNVHIVWEHREAIYHLSESRGRWSGAVRLSEQGARHPTVGVWTRGIFTIWQDERGLIRLRTFDSRWRPVQHLGRGDYPNATPWKPRDGRAYAAWTTQSGIRVENLEPMLVKR